MLTGKRCSEENSRQIYAKQGLYYLLFLDMVDCERRISSVVRLPMVKSWKKLDVVALTLFLFTE